MMKPIPLLISSAIVVVMLFSFFSGSETEVHVFEDGKVVEKKAEETWSEPVKKNSDKPPVMEQQGIKEAIRGVAKSYAEQSRFPSSSMPIPDEESLQKYIPNQASGASLPYEGPNGENWRFGLRTDHYRYFKGDTINFYVTLTGSTEMPSANVRLYLVSNKTVIHEVAVGSLVAGAFQASVDTNSVNTSGWPKELHVQAVADLGGQNMQVVETIRFEEPIGEIKSVGSGEVDGANLVIPVAIDTDASGFFRVTAVLFSDDGKTPLVHLEGKAKLSINNDTVELKAHADALKLSGDQGPYQLQHVYIEKMPGPPDYASAYGKNSDEVFSISSQSFESYSDVRHEDPSAQRSLEFLNKMGGNQTQP